MTSSPPVAHTSEETSRSSLTAAHSPAASTTEAPLVLRITSAEDVAKAVAACRAWADELERLPAPPMAGPDAAYDALLARLPAISLEWSGENYLGHDLARAFVLGLIDANLVSGLEDGWSEELIAFRNRAQRPRAARGEAKANALAKKVLTFVSETPGCSKRAIRAGIKRKGAEVDAVIDSLIEQGAITNAGSDKAHKYLVTER